MYGGGEDLSLAEELRLWLQLVLLPSAGLTDHFYIPACAPYNKTPTQLRRVSFGAQC